MKRLTNISQTFELMDFLYIRLSIVKKKDINCLRVVYRELWLFAASLMFWFEKLVVRLEKKTSYTRQVIKLSMCCL